MKKEDCIEITLVKIQIGDKTIELTTAELRRLSDVIKDLIGPVPADPVYIPYIAPVHPPGRYWDNPQFGEPIWVNPNTETWPSKWTCTTQPLAQGVCLSVMA